MPDRLTRESISTSPSLNRCSLMAHLFFENFLRLADSHGRFCADPDIMASTMMPKRVVRGEVTPDLISGVLTEYEREGMVRLYEVDGERWGYFVNFKKHNGQLRRVGKSKLPPPPDTDGTTPDTDGSAHTQRGGGEAPQRPRENTSTLRVPPEILRGAEHVLARPLSPRDVQTLNRWVHSEDRPLVWLLRAFEKAEECEPAKHTLAYVEGILNGFQRDGGPGRRDKRSNRVDDEDRSTWPELPDVCYQNERKS